MIPCHRCAPYKSITLTDAENGHLFRIHSCNVRKMLTLDRRRLSDALALLPPDRETLTIADLFPDTDWSLIVESSDEIDGLMGCVSAEFPL